MQVAEGLRNEIDTTGTIKYDVSRRNDASDLNYT